MGEGSIGVIETDVGREKIEVDIRDFGGDKVKMEEMHIYDALLAQGLTYQDEEAEMENNGMGLNQSWFC
eukprot:1960857-Ditylum_brightwellii.AAC.2